MDYEMMIGELKTYDDYGRKQMKETLKWSDLDNKHTVNEKWTSMYPAASNDAVNSPSHYAYLRNGVEAIDVIEDAIASAPTVVEGMLQGQVLKYLLRLWHKDNPKQDAEKSLWYLKRLIEKMEG